MKRFFTALFALVALATSANAAITITKSTVPQTFPNVCLNDSTHWCIKANASAAWTTSGNGEFTRNASGTGAAWNIAGFALGNAEGWLQAELGTVNTNFVDLRTSTDTLVLGIGTAHFFMRGREGTLSDGTNTQGVRVGYIDGSASSTESSDACELRYTHSVNSGKWQAICYAGGVAGTPVDTGVTFTANTVRSYEITINAAATSASFFIDGAAVATISADHIPQTTDYTGCGFNVRRTAGTANIIPFSYTFMACQVDFTTARW